MIDILFKFGSDVIIVKIEGHKVLFGNTSYGNVLTTIDGLVLSKQGVIKEFPDLENNDDWAIEASKRFKEKIFKMEGEKEIANYIINDLKKYGYIPWKMEENGKRPINL